MHLMGGAGLSLRENEVEFGVGVDAGEAQDDGIDALLDGYVCHVDVLGIPGVAGVSLADQLTVDVQGEGSGVTHLHADGLIHGGDQTAD